MGGFCNVCVCVCVWVCVCVGFVTCVCVCGFCNVCVCVYGGFNNCVGVLVVYVLEFTVFFVLFRLCIFILISLVCTGVRTTATECN